MHMQSCARFPSSLPGKDVLREELGVANLLDAQVPAHDLSLAGQRLREEAQHQQGRVHARRRQLAGLPEAGEGWLSALRPASCCCAGAQLEDGQRLQHRDLVAAKPVPKPAVLRQSFIALAAPAHVYE